MGPGAEAVPSLPAGHGPGHGLRPLRVQRQSKTFERRSGPQEAEDRYSCGSSPSAA